MIPGIDVSHYQGDIDWQEVAQSGIKFAYIKCTEGWSFVDPKFEQNWAEATNAGILCGAYHFMTDCDPILQASLLRKTGPAFGLPPALDIELPSITRKAVNAFLHAVKLPVVLYLDAWLLDEFEDAQALGPLWVAHYGAAQPAIGTWPKWTFWQHTASGQIPGITGAVDLDWFNGTEDDLLKLVRVAS
jgi:lysozyme